MLSFLKLIQYPNNFKCLITRIINHSFLLCSVRGKLILHINTNDNDYHNMRNQYQHQNPGSITGILALSLEVYKSCRTLRPNGKWKRHHCRCLLSATSSVERSITSKLSYFGKQKRFYSPA